MPPIEEQAGSSPAETTPTPASVEAVPTATPEVAPSAASTPAPPSDETPAGDALFDAVQAALKPAPSTEGSPTEPVPQAEGSPEVETTDGAEQGQQPEDPDAKLPFHNHPRWKEIHAQARQLKEVLPEAQAWRQFNQNLSQARLTREEVNEGLGIMALLKRHDDRAALEQARNLLADHLHNLDVALGNVIPEEIAQRIETGEIAEDAAAEMARLRAETNRLRSVREAQAQEAAQAAQVQAFQRVEQDLAVWEQRVRASEPDYAAKAELYRMAMQDTVRRAGRLPSSSEEAISWAQHAKASVDRAFQARQPVRPTAKTPTSTAASRAAPVAPNSGKTFDEVIAAALSS